jgi:pimeloyl-ACP methyl ester carboxylesterase
MYHHFGRVLRYGKNTTAYFSRNPNGKALIFVHGFGGDALGTWKQMNELLLEERKAANWDIFFYGYESMDAQAAMSAGLLRQFIEVLTDPNQQLRRAHSPHDPVVQQVPNYREVVIVAHSLGAAIARRAILDAVRSSESWVKKCKLVLFAPAHQGAFVLALAKELTAAAKFLTAVFAIGRFAVPVLDDLQVGSRFLEQLHRETVDSLRKIRGKDKSPLVASMTIFGQRDRVVVNTGSYCGVQKSMVWERHGHRSICKATPDFRDPFDVVVNVL